MSMADFFIGFKERVGPEEQNVKGSKRYTRTSKFPIIQLHLQPLTSYCIT